MGASQVKPEATLVLRLRRLRNKARVAAATEVVALVRPAGQVDPAIAFPKTRWACFRWVR